MQTPLKQIVGYFLTLNNYGKSEYAKAYSIAIRGWKELNRDISGGKKTIPLDVDCDGTACIPPYVGKILKVGVLTDCGEYAALTEDSNLAEPVCADAEYHTGKAVQLTGGKRWETPGDFHSYGIGSHHSIGRYRLFRKENKILLAPDTPYRQIIIEAIVRPTPDGEYMVDDLEEEALLAFINWQWNVANRNMGVTEKALLKDEWLSQKRDAKYRMKAPIHQLINQNSRLHTKMGLKS